jgi:hypothetical protein
MLGWRNRTEEVASEQRTVDSKEESILPRRPKPLRVPPPHGGQWDIQAGRSFVNYRRAPDPKEDLEIIKQLFLSYRMVVKNNNQRVPMGNNREVTAQLTGDNPSAFELLKKDDPSIVDGQLVDRWGTPLMFHFVSSTSCDVRSAGPDGRIGNEDDLEVKGHEKILYSERE